MTHPPANRRTGGERTMRIAEFQARDLALMGMGQIAYLREGINKEGAEIWVVFAADGSELGSFSRYDIAWAATKQNNLQPLWVN